MADGCKCLDARQFMIAVAGICLLTVALYCVYPLQSTHSPKLGVVKNVLRQWAHLLSNASPASGVNSHNLSMLHVLNPLVSICVPTRSVSVWKSLSESSLQSILVPSILRTVTPTELDKYRVHLYLGINHDDSFWVKHVGQLSTPNWLVVHAGFYNMTKNRIPFNEVTRAAYDDGAEYLLRVNDDTEFVTKGWITAAVQTLSGYNPPNVGMVGPTCNEGNTAVFTHDMVHRTHCDIFGNYFPPVFENWYLDDWITRVYGPDRSTKLTNWRVIHHQLKTRYTPNTSIETFLAGELTKGRKTILNFLNLKF